MEQAARSGKSNLDFLNSFCRMKLAYYWEASFNKAFLLKVCRIPNKPVLSFRGGQLGCLTVVFSPAGTMLAAACADRDSFPVVGR